MTLADEAWIKEIFINIVNETEKDSDRIRALASLQKYAGVLPEQQSSGRKEENEELSENSSAFFFDGEDTAIL